MQLYLYKTNARTQKTSRLILNHTCKKQRKQAGDEKVGDNFYFMQEFHFKVGLFYFYLNLKKF